MQKERGEGGGGRRRNAGEYNGYAKTEEAFMERRHVFPRAIPPPLLRAPLIPGLDRRSRKLGRSKFSLPTNFLLERKEEERRGEVIFLMFLFPSSFLLLLSPLLFVSSNRVNRIFCSVFDGGHLIWEGTGGERDDKFGVNFAYFGIIHQSIAAYVRTNRTR